jgi:hypothetical protein
LWAFGGRRDEGIFQPPANLVVSDHNPPVFIDSDLFGREFNPSFCQAQYLHCQSVLQLETLQVSAPQPDCIRGRWRLVELVAMAVYWTP